MRVEFKAALLALLITVRFVRRHFQLEELDDESYDAGVSDWQSFLRECVEIVSKISELLPGQVFGIVYPAFQVFEKEIGIHVKICSPLWINNPSQFHTGTTEHIYGARSVRA